MGGSTSLLPVSVGGGGIGNCGGFCSILGGNWLFTFVGGGGRRLGGRIAWLVVEGKRLLPLVMGGGGREFCEPPTCGETLFPGKIGDGRREGLVAACVGVSGPLAGVLGD